MTNTKGSDDQSGNKSRNEEEKQSSSATENSQSTANEERQDGAQSRSAADTKQGKVDKTADKSVTDAGRKGGQSAQTSGHAAAQQNGKARGAGSSGGQAQDKSPEKSATDSKQASPSSAARSTTPASAKPAADTAKDRQKPGKNSGKLAVIIAVIAIILALVALAGAAWVWQRSNQGVTSLEARINNLGSSVKADIRDWVAPQIDDMHSTVEAMQSQVNNVAAADKQQAQALSELRAQLDNTRLQVAGMAQQLQGNMRRWQLQQIEYLLVIANRRLQLYREPAQASAALKLASDLVSRINDPRLFDVRKKIINSIAALDALPSPDIQGIALTLSAFVGQIDQLPLASDLPQEYKTKNAPQAAPTNAATGPLGIDWSSGWHRFTDSVGQALNSMATIRRSDGTQPALLPPNQVYFLRQNLILQLRSARLALLEGNAKLYRDSLSTAVAWLQEYFVTDNAAVQAMIERLGQMQNIKLDWQAPDISGGLRALHDYMQARGQEDAASRQQATAESGASTSKQGGQ